MAQLDFRNRIPQTENVVLVCVLHAQYGFDDHVVSNP